MTKIPPYTIKECQETIREGLKAANIDSLHGWILLAKLASDKETMRAFYENSIKNMNFTDKVVDKN